MHSFRVWFRYAGEVYSWCFWRDLYYRNGVGGVNEISCHGALDLGSTRSLNDLHNWLQSHRALDLGSTSMLVQATEEVGEDSIPLTDSTQIPIIDQPSTSSQPKKKQKSGRKQRKEAETAHAEIEEEEHFNTPSK
ncbi:hypothetical protein Tco_0363149 [Tanacetum coccineum]